MATTTCIEATRADQRASRERNWEANSAGLRWNVEQSDDGQWALTAVPWFVDCPLNGETLDEARVEAATLLLEQLLAASQAVVLDAPVATLPAAA